MSSCPGRARASAISSRVLRAGSDGCTTIACGEMVTIVIGTRSLYGSYGSFA
jgi:hypothetical protein